MRERNLIALFLIAILALAGWAGSSDFEEAQREEARYCEMVKGGHWPAYNPDIECEGER